MDTDIYAPDTRTRILEAARDAFSEHGYDGASIRQIVAKAGANVASVNYHFGNKDALYEAVIKDSLSDIKSSLERVVQEVRDISDADERILNFAKARIRAGLGKRFLNVPKIVGWEILSPRINNTAAVMDSGLVGSGSEIDELLRPVIDVELSEENWEIVRLWFMAATLPSPPVARRLTQALGSDATDEETDKMITPIATAAVCGLKSFAVTLVE